MGAQIQGNESEFPFANFMSGIIRCDIARCKDCGVSGVTASAQPWAGGLRGPAAAAAPCRGTVEPAVAPDARLGQPFRPAPPPLRALRTSPAGNPATPPPAQHSHGAQLLSCASDPPRGRSIT